MLRLNALIAVLCLCAAIVGSPQPVTAEEAFSLSEGETVYVPAYAHIYVGGKKHPFTLAVTLSIRNINLEADITITAVHYYGTDGKLLKTFVDQPIPMKPQESTRFVVAERDKGGGSGANFIVKWRAAEKVNPPIIEAIMIGTQSGQGVSFTSRGRAISP